MSYEYTVLDDRSSGDELSHREIVEDLLPKLREEMSEDEYQFGLAVEVRAAVINSITLELSNNLSSEDWHGMGFQYPEDFLNAEAVADTIGDRAQHYFENDQTGKSWDVARVILEYAEEYDLVESVE